MTNSNLDLKTQSSGSSKLMILGVIVVIIAIVVGGVYFLNNKVSEPAISNDIVNTPELTTEITTENKDEVIDNALDTALEDLDSLDTEIDFEYIDDELELGL